MIYEEGGLEAFQRLQRTIMENTYDHSLFAWTQRVGQGDSPGLAAHGMLATSPAHFADTSSLVPTKDPKLARAYRMTNRGLEIELRLTCTLEGGEYIALLDCEEKESKRKHGIYLASMDDGRFIRTRLDQLADEPTWSHRSYTQPILQKIYVPQDPQSSNSVTPAQQLYHFEIVRYRDAGRYRDIFRENRIFRDNDSDSTGHQDSSKISRLLDLFSAKLLSRAYSLAITTSPEESKRLIFTLKTGGRVGCCTGEQHRR